MKRKVNGMTQLAIYIDDKLAERLDKAVKASGKSKSRWVADAIRHSLDDQWPQNFFDLAGVKRFQFAVDYRSGGKQHLTVIARLGENTIRKQIPAAFADLKIFGKYTCHCQHVR